MANRFTESFEPLSYGVPTLGDVGGPGTLQILFAVENRQNGRVSGLQWERPSLPTVENRENKLCVWVYLVTSQHGTRRVPVNAHSAAIAAVHANQRDCNGAALTMHGSVMTSTRSLHPSHPWHLAGLHFNGDRWWCQLRPRVAVMERPTARTSSYPELLINVPFGKGAVSAKVFDSHVHELMFVEVVHVFRYRCLRNGGGCQ